MCKCISLLGLKKFVVVVVVVVVVVTCSYKIRMDRFAVSQDLFHLGFFGARSRVPARFRVSVDVR